MNKPLVVEEFGVARDGGGHDASSPTTSRDAFYARLCRLLSERPGVAGIILLPDRLLTTHGFLTIYSRLTHDALPVSGLNFWAWGGEGRPKMAGGVWQVGDSWVGDPPHELQVAISHQPSVISHQSSVISHQPSVISHQPSAISNWVGDS